MMMKSIAVVAAVSVVGVDAISRYDGKVSLRKGKVPVRKDGKTKYLQLPTAKRVHPISLRDIILDTKPYEERSDDERSTSASSTQESVSGSPAETDKFLPPAEILKVLAANSGVEPPTWDEMRDIVTKGQAEPSQFKRLDRVPFQNADGTWRKTARTWDKETKYQEYRANYISKFKSIGDFINIEKMGFRAMASPQQLLAASPQKIISVPPQPMPKKVIWAANDFGYYLEKDVHHDIIWLSGFPDEGVGKRTSVLGDYDIKAVLCKAKPAADWEVMVWENTWSPSIPDVRHLQILSRPRGPASPAVDEHQAYCHGF